VAPCRCNDLAADTNTFFATQQKLRLEGNVFKRQGGRSDLAVQPQEVVRLAVADYPMSGINAAGVFVKIGDTGLQR
jgi:hypothetical protein